MRRVRSNRGVALMDAAISIFLLAVAAVVFGAAFPSGFASIRQSAENARATAIAQRKLEQVRTLPYEQLSYTSLRAANAIDDDADGAPPFSFTAVDSLSTQLTNGRGTVDITDQSSSVKLVVVTVTYDGPNGVERQVVLRTFIADKRTKYGS